MIERENKKFHYRRSNKQLEKEIKEKKEEIIKLKEKIKYFKERHQCDIEHMRTSMKN